jgi:amino acid transporter
VSEPTDSITDVDDLRQLGYEQQLQRSMGGFSSFAIAFSLISINTGIFANFGFGLQQVGPAVIWSWLVVMLGQFLVALVLAQLSQRYPISGYGYQWTSRLVGPRYGFFVGWLLLLQFLTGFPGVCRALADYFMDFVEGPQTGWLGPSGVTVLIISAIAIIHLLGIRLVAMINDAGVMAEMVGAILITVVLLVLFGWAHPDGLQFLLRPVHYQTQQAPGLGAWALSLLMGAWCLTGFEAAADMAEETHQPRRVVPRAVIGSQLTAGLGGLAMLAAFLLAIGDLGQVQASPTPLLLIMQQRLGATVASWAMAVVFLSIFACGVASLAATTRLIYSLARDNMLPGASLFKQVHAVRRTPVGAIFLVWGVSSVVVLALDRIELITSVSAVAGYLGYAGIVLATLWPERKLPGLELKAGEGGFDLGRWRLPISWMALLWLVGLVLALTVPDAGDGRLPAKAAAVGIGVGGLVYLLVIRRRIDLGRAGPPMGRSVGSVVGVGGAGEIHPADGD